MAAAIRDLKLLIPPLFSFASSLSASSSSTSLCRWASHSLKLSSFLVFAILLSMVAPLERDNETVLFPGETVHGSAVDNITKEDSAHTSPNNGGANGSRKFTEGLNSPMVTSRNNFKERFSAGTGYSLPSGSEGSIRREMGSLDVLEPGTPRMSKKRYSHSGEDLAARLKLFDSTSMKEFCNSILSCESDQEVKEGNKKAKDIKDNKYYLEMKSHSLLARSLPRTVSGKWSPRDNSVTKNMGPIRSEETRNSLVIEEMSKNDWLYRKRESLSRIDSSSPKPDNTRLPFGTSVPYKTKRYVRSADSASDDILSHATADGQVTGVLHFVNKLQEDPELCQIPGKRIIILQNHKSKPEQFFPVFSEEVKQTVHIANTINDLLLYTTSNPDTFMDVFFAMTQSLVETGSKVTGCAIAFNLTPKRHISASTTASPLTTARSHTQGPEQQSLFPYSYRTKDGEVVVTDLSRLYKPQTTTWFSVHANKSFEGLLKPRSRIYANRTDIGKLTNYKARWNKTVSVTAEDGYWATPYYDCVLRNWVVQYSVPFYQLDGLTPEFK